jgi:hypothetical protein
MPSALDFKKFQLYINYNIQSNKITQHITAAGTVALILLTILKLFLKRSIKTPFGT